MSGLLLNDNRISGTIPSELGDLFRTLSKLHLYGNSISGSVPSELARFRKMRECQITYVQFLQDDVIKGFNLFGGTIGQKKDSNFFECPIPEIENQCGRALYCNGATAPEPPRSEIGSNISLPPPLEKTIDDVMDELVDEDDDDKSKDMGPFDLKPFLHPDPYDDVIKVPEEQSSLPQSIETAYGGGTTTTAAQGGLASGAKARALLSGAAIGVLAGVAAVGAAIASRIRCSYRAAAGSH